MPRPPKAHAAPGVPVKRRSTYYTSERVTAARHNVATYDWAATLRDEAVAGADTALQISDEQAWHQIPAQSIPRSITATLDRTIGSPITGDEIYDFGIYPWLAEPYTKPWKLTDPSSDYVFPTNDFAAFYASGLNSAGEFDRSLADESLLVNELYPDRGPTWGVDDGYGWIDENGIKWAFVAYYAHWFTWYKDTAVVHQAVNFLRDAFVYTGNLNYARRGLIMLDRVADLYPELSTSEYPMADGYFNADGHTNLGKAVGCEWEPYLVRDLTLAYDAFLPAIIDADHAGVLPVLASLAEQYPDLAPKDTIESVRANIEQNLLREIVPAVKEARIRSNFPLHQAAVAAAAVVLDHPAESNEWLDFLYASGGFQYNPYRVDGGDVYNRLVGLVDRDGFLDESSPAYNVMGLGNFDVLADLLQGYDSHPAESLYEHPKLRKMFEQRYSLAMLNAYQPHIGDSQFTGNPSLEFSNTAQALTKAFELYGKKEYAQTAVIQNGGTVDGLYSNVFATDVEGTQQRVQEILDSEGTLHLPAINLTGYGIAALRAGVGDRMRAAWMYYGRSLKHGHKDSLNLGYFGHGINFTPDLGHAAFGGKDRRRQEFTINTVAHNTVVVNAGPQVRKWDATPLGFAVTDRVHFAEVSSPNAYPDDVSVYRRAIATVAIDEDDAYLVDVFRVVGGTQHHYSFHGAEGTVSGVDLNLVPQDGGTYAGADVEVPDGSLAADPDASGFAWLINVERDEAPPRQFGLDWDIVDTWDVHPDPDPDLHMRLTMLTEVDDIALADGIPAQNRPGNPETLRYLIAARRSDGEYRYIEEDDPAVSFTGTWVRYTGSQPHGGAHRLSHPNTPDASVTVTWTGGRAQLLGSSGHSGQVHGLARAVLDGEDLGIVSFSRPSQVYQHVMFDTGEIPDGDHTLTLTATGEKGEHARPQDVGIRISFDALVIPPPELRSQFVSVIEPYLANPKIAAVERVAVRPMGGALAEHEAAAVKVTLASGRTDYVVSCTRPDVPLRVDNTIMCTGRFAVVSYDGAPTGRPSYTMLHDGDRVTPSVGGRVTAPAGTGTIVDFTRTMEIENSITVRFAGASPDLGDITGQYVYVENDGVRNATYLIHDATPLSDTDVRLDIGDATLIRSYVDEDDFEAGYVYDIAEGAAFRIPTTVERG
ncbi:heparinase II/III domain-containing protein [Propionibacteriaceae bacterium Y2011]